MASVITTVADAVAAELNAAPENTFGLEFQAQRVFIPEQDLTAADALSVCIVPRGLEESMASRGLVQLDVSVDIGIRKKIDPDEPTELDALNDLVDAITRYVRLRSLGTLAAARWVKNAMSVAYSQEHLREFGQFTCVLVVTYRLMEQV